ncbi:MAG: CIA30 family protein [Pseudomonadales bacterium]|nr:CIA30 family protein [Pseudomonadales bacterium]
MKLLMAIWVLALSSKALCASVLTEFDDDQQDIQWRVVNDSVMGGRSIGDFQLDAGRLIFSGKTNTRGGGFSSIRSVPGRLRIPVDAIGVELVGKGDGRTYTFRVQTSSGTSYWADFPTSGDWQPIQIPFSDFLPRWRGRLLTGPPLDPSQIVSLGLMIYDKEDGDFSITLDKITLL